MNKSVKFFIASLIVLAAAIGFFAGSFCNKPCSKAIPAAEGMTPPPPPALDDQGPHAKGPDMKGPKNHKGPSPEMMDSLLQVTPEQKAALEKNRMEQDSTFKALRKNKFEAEKALGEALDSEDSVAIETAKAKVMEIQKELLDHRINAMAALNKILSKEQRDKFRQFHKDNMKKFKHHKGHKGPKGPKGSMPKASEQN